MTRPAAKLERDAEILLRRAAGLPPRDDREAAMYRCYAELEALIETPPPVQPEDGWQDEVNAAARKEGIL